MHKVKLFESAVIAGATNSISQRLRYIRDLSVQIIISAVSSPSGASVKLQASNDDINYTDISGTSSAISATGNILINVDGAGYKYIRAVFAIASGTITAEVIFVGKEHNIN